jgi:hypothetical protein
MSLDEPLAMVRFAYTVLAVVMVAAFFEPAKPTRPEPLQERLARAVTRTTDWARIRSCLDRERVLPGDRTAKAAITQALATAVVAVESYARPSWIRSLEFTIARAYLATTGTLPDMSLGAAQMKPSTAVKIVAQTEPSAALPVIELWRRLKDTCESVRLARLYFNQNLAGDIARGELIDVRLGSTIATYNGQSAKRINGRGSGEIYSGVVLSLTGRLLSGLDFTVPTAWSSLDGKETERLGLAVVP